jgi:hypothetical protein
MDENANACAAAAAAMRAAKAAADAATIAVNAAADALAALNAISATTAALPPGMLPAPGAACPKRFGRSRNSISGKRRNL